MAQGAPALLHLSRWNLGVFLLSCLLSTAVMVVFLVNVFRCFRRLHALSRLRALVGFVIGLLFALAFLAAFIMPYEGAIDRAFAKK